MDDYASHFDGILDSISEAFTQRMNVSLNATSSSSGRQKSSRGNCATSAELLCQDMPG